MNAAFYCVADASATSSAPSASSTRCACVGHDEPIVLLDCGLTAAQRELLGPRSSCRGAGGRAPDAAQGDRPAARPADVDGPARHRPRRHAPADRARRVGARRATSSRSRRASTAGSTSGASCSTSARSRARHLPRLRAARAWARGVGSRSSSCSASARTAIDFERTMWGAHDEDYPLLYADQDVLNAILAARVDRRAQVVARPAARAGAAVRGPARRRRAHAALRLRRRRRALRRPPLHRQAVARADPPRRLLAAAAPAADRRRRRDPGPRGEIPLRLRRGPLAYAERMRVNARERIRFRRR